MGSLGCNRIVRTSCTQNEEIELRAVGGHQKRGVGLVMERNRKKGANWQEPWQVLDVFYLRLAPAVATLIDGADENACSVWRHLDRKLESHEKDGVAAPGEVFAYRRVVTNEL